MLRKFRNLDKIEILQNAVNCLTAENERLKQKNENLEIKLDLTKNYWNKWQKDFEAEHIRIKGLLATRERETKKRTKQLMQAEQISDDRLMIVKDLKEKIAKKDMQLEASRDELFELNEGFCELKALLHEQKEENKRLRKGMKK